MKILTDTDLMPLKKCREFDRLHGRIYNPIDGKYERPFLMQLIYFFRRIFFSKALIKSEMPGTMKPTWKVDYYMVEDIAVHVDLE
jgi:hypothetical protein